LNWCIIDKVTTRNTTAYFFWPTRYNIFGGFIGSAEYDVGYIHMHD